MPKIFISYARSDRENVEQFVRALRAANITGWLDATDIAAGESLSSAVRDALRISSGVVVFLSYNALHNEWVQFEIGAAEALGKTIIPVIISGNDLEKSLPDILRNRKLIDARNRPPSSVAQDISHALGSERS